MTNLALAFLAAGLGAGLSIIGAALGIGKLAAAAMDATGRQPAAGGDIRTTMIIAAALIEGATLFALVVSLVACGVLLNVSRYSKGQAYIERSPKKRQTVRTNAVRRTGPPAARPQPIPPTTKPGEAIT